jgi:hypothetical protein
VPAPRRRAYWLAAHGVTHVAMKSTGVHRRPVFHILEEAFTCVFADAAQTTPQLQLLG